MKVNIPGFGWAEYSPASVDWWLGYANYIRHLYFGNLSIEEALTVIKKLREENNV